MALFRSPQFRSAFSQLPSDFHTSDNSDENDLDAHPEGLHSLFIYQVDVFERARNDEDVQKRS